MKLKIFRIALLSSLLLVFGLNIYFFAQTIIYVINSSDKSDSAIFIISIIVLTLFIGLQIFNTIVSFKKGSSFLVALDFEGEAVNKKFVIGTSVALPIAIFVVIYFSLIVCGYSLPLSTLYLPVIYLIINLFVLVTVDCIFIIFYPLVGRLDKGYIERK